MSLNLSIKCEYPDLPVVSHRQEFLDLVEKHQVVIVQADTGSGKSTQLPKFLLEAYVAKLLLAKQKYESKPADGDTPKAEFDVSKVRLGRIGITQPRRLAALSIADRLREELKDEELVSSKIRFFEDGPADAPIKVMTDGILLQEFRRDRLFKAYSAIMIDEAHERSLNIDILLGIFKTVLKERPDFRLIIASATMDAALFKDFYPGSAVLSAEGRTFPVDVEYYFDGNKGEKRFGIDDDRDDFSGKGDCGVLDEAAEAIVDLESRRRDNLLCFLPTERDIQDLTGILEKDLGDSFEILPLFGRMSPADQKKVFKSSGKTRIVLATNIAETSLTIPGIAYVVDSGMARVSRYNAQARIQGLPVEDISQASARQRTGRAGRVKPGVCIRLYSQKDFQNRDAYTEPEIRRSNLANVVLQLKSLGLSVESFEFLQSPPRSSFRGAYKTLFELGAVSGSDSNSHVTEFGREMSKLPMDVALSAVLLRARDAGVLQPAIVVCSALSIQDPRLTPQDENARNKAREIHRKFGGHKSDFLTFLSIWNAFCKEWDGNTWNKLRKFCEKNYLHFLRCREWIDLVDQYSRILKVEVKERTGEKLACPLESFHTDNLHIALLAGFLGGIAKKDVDNGCFRLVSGRDSYVFPGSDCAKKTPDWILSAEVRETSRVFLTKNAEIKPEWILQVAEPFCTRRWFEPTWNKDRGFVEAVEEVSFKGFVISRGRRVDYARINPEECAEIFFREAVVNMDMARPFPFMQHNAKVLETLSAAEARLRRFGLAPSEELQVERFVATAPGVNSIKTLKDFIRDNGDEALRYSVEEFLQESNTGISHTEAFSHRMNLNDLQKNRKQKETPKLGGSLESIRLLGRILTGEIVFDSKRECDGLTLQVPADMLARLSPAKFALEIKRYRDWIIDAFFSGLTKEAAKKSASLRTRLDDAFCDVLEAHDEYSPVRALAEAGATIPLFANADYALNPEKEHHLNLHLLVESRSFSTNCISTNGNSTSSNSEILKIELSPEWGAFRYLEALQNLVPEVISDLPFGTLRYGSRGSSVAVMETPEADFFRALVERTSTIQHPENASAALDRISLLEMGGAHAACNCPATPKDLIYKSLICSEWHPEYAERFSGIEFAKGKRVKDFRELAPDFRSGDTLARFGLVRLCYESALLGGSAFTKCWNRLREVTTNLRHGKKIPDDIERIAIAVTEAPSVYEILRIAVKFLDLDIYLPESAANPLENLDVRSVRDEFRPFLQAKFLREDERREVRDALGILEKTSTASPEFLSRYLNAKLLFEKYDALRLRRGLPEEEEEIEEDALAKLKMKFGKLK